MRCWADKGHQEAGGTVRVPYRGRWDKLSEGQQAVAVLKSWRLLRKLCYSTTRITDLVKAVLTLHMATSS